MLSPVVLHHQLQLGLAEVEAAPHPAVFPEDLVVHLGFRPACEHEQHPQPRLHRRVHSVSHPGGCPRGNTGTRVPGCRAEVMQLSRCGQLEADEVVAGHHEIDQVQEPGQLDEQLVGGETRTPFTTVTAASGLATWLLIPGLRRRSLAASTLTCTSGSQGTAAP